MLLLQLGLFHGVRQAGALVDLIVVLHTLPTHVVSWFGAHNVRDVFPPQPSEGAFCDSAFPWKEEVHEIGLNIGVAYTSIHNQHTSLIHTWGSHRQN